MVSFLGTELKQDAKPLPCGQVQSRRGAGRQGRAAFHAIARKDPRQRDKRREETFFSQPWGAQARQRESRCRGSAAKACLMCEQGSKAGPRSSQRPQGCRSGMRRDTKPRGRETKDCSKQDRVTLRKKDYVPNGMERSPQAPQSPQCARQNTSSTLGSANGPMVAVTRDPVFPPSHHESSCLHV